jgi:hypothetical protein
MRGRVVEQGRPEEAVVEAAGPQEVPWELTAMSAAREGGCPTDQS